MGVQRARRSRRTQHPRLPRHHQAPDGSRDAGEHAGERRHRDPGPVRGADADHLPQLLRVQQTRAGGPGVRERREALAQLREGAPQDVSERRRR